jgi:neutral ceramidase
MNMRSTLRFALACIFTWLAASGSIQAELKAGAARISIVPPFPTQMGGFHDRIKNFQGVHDELFARALVLDNGGTRLVFIGSDLMAIDAELVRLAREAITQATQIPAAQILISCTHNHSAPSYYQKSKPGEDDVEPSLKKFLAKQFSSVAIEAHQNLAPARIGFGAGSLIGATRNRQQRNDLIDPQVGVLRVESTEGRKTIATLFNFTGHPVIIGSTNMFLSGEYPGAASRAVENLLGGVAIFAQGACGDITVNRSGDPFMEIERLGRTVAGEVIKVSGLIQCTDDVSLKFASQTLKLPARSLPDLDAAKQALAQGQAALDAAKAKPAPTAVVQTLDDKLRVLSMAVMRAEAIAADPTKKETELTAEVQVLQVGSVIYAAIPGEIFVEYALELRQRVKQDTGHSFCLIGYANGYLGYIVTPRAMETGGYEASVTRLQPLGGRSLTEAVMELVQQLDLN